MYSSIHSLIYLKERDHLPAASFPKWPCSHIWTRLKPRARSLQGCSSPSTWNSICSLLRCGNRKLDRKRNSQTWTNTPKSDASVATGGLNCCPTTLFQRALPFHKQLGDVLWVYTAVKTTTQVKFTTPPLPHFPGTTLLPKVSPLLHHHTLIFLLLNFMYVKK